MLVDTRQIVFDAIHKSIAEYYNEYEPKKYERTYKFLNSLVKTKIVRTGNTLSCEVKIDEDYLEYNYPYTGLFEPSYPHHYDGRFAQGIDVVNWANNKFPDDDEAGGTHGYTIVGNSGGFWDRAMEDIGNILVLLKQNLSKQGIHLVR